jgi:hypothetical protein
MTENKDKKEPVTPITTPIRPTTPLNPPPLTTATPPPTVVPPVVKPSAAVPSPEKVDAIVDKHRAEKDAKKKELLELMGAAIKEFNGEGNIPIDHDYWGARNEYRRLSQP